MKKILPVLIIAFIIFLFAKSHFTEKSKVSTKEGDKIMDKINVNKDNIKTIYLAGGCFWGVEGYFQRIEGVVDTEVGYANGKSDSTNYNILSTTDHAETLKLDYDISKVSLEELLLHYFRIIDPKSLNRQGNDIGRQYRTGIYYIDEKDLDTINKIMDYERKKHGEIVVELEKLENFVVGEEYHQDYLNKNPGGYCHVNLETADDPLVDEEYLIPSKEELRERFDDLTYDVIVNAGTEKPGTSELNKEYRRGIYVDKVTGEPLFASQDKFDAGCGWPSFSKPILTGKIKELEDKSFGMNRVEVRSEKSDAHLGHVFDDGPKDKGGLRYCINGVSLEFIPYEEMEEKGYKEYMVLVE